MLEVTKDSQQSVADSTGHTSDLQAEIVKAISTLLCQYKDPKKGLRILAKKMGIHEKTLNRILQGENRPGYQTVYKIFRVVFNVYNDAQVLQMAPASVRQFLEKATVQVLSPEKNYTPLADLELQRNPIGTEIFVLAGTGPIRLEQIQERFGAYGLEILGKLKSKGLLEERQKGLFVTGRNHPVFDGEMILAAGSVMTASHAKPQMTDERKQNFVSFYAEGLTTQAYQAWIRADEEAYQKKLAIAREPTNLGSVRVFTFMVTEQIRLSEER